jgi:predicted DNA-binding antitoxin AbrB/MazE fold protein
MAFEKEDYSVLQIRYESILKKLEYIECDIGWFDIIDEALKDIQNVSFEEGENIQVVQIKEKFGGLRIYYDAETEDEDRLRRLEDIVYNAEKVSYTVCEICGEAGKPNKKSWIKTLCVEHSQR